MLYCYGKQLDMLYCYGKQLDMLYCYGKREHYLKTYARLTLINQQFLSVIALPGMSLLSHQMFDRGQVEMT